MRSWFERTGSSALAGNTSGNNNIGIGFFGGSSITTANNVIAIGAAGVDTTAAPAGPAARP